MEIFININILFPVSGLCHIEDLAFLKKIRKRQENIFFLHLIVNVVKFLFI
jgi:hypothetical protein